MALPVSAPLFTPTNLIRYIAYYRVSTKQQGDSGLGLAAQQAALASFVHGPILAQFTEVESDKNNGRVQLTQASISYLQKMSHPRRRDDSWVLSVSYR